MVASFLLAFCRLVLSFVFALSFVGKLRDVRGLRQTILNFHILPHWLNWLSGVITFFVLVSELLVIMGGVLGGMFLLPTFVFAAFLLILFSGTLMSVLVRQVHTSCNCFGKSDKPVSVGDLWRNGGLLCCALGGSALFFWSQQEQASLPWAAWFLAGGAGIVFVALLFSIGDLIALFQSW
ncbi:MauE/DoxX family redox-associated membrane protein [Ktedonospora formicarum]|uniref:Methylamine utilization protein MauE n=1 Tax=Ktedonospora formicarum TaxID=2778364 RepID=A0A8J3MV10_9CHLR|nr:MauE/DoxX family redox-associated membrane protein [Ktedonospora formicarum]GHO45980.1 methylamine utilization protein MauE [Ktedonospora formicarum]